MTAPDVRPAGQKRRKPKKPPRQNLSAQCDALFAKLIRQPGVCRIEGCGATTQLQCCHHFSRRYRAVRWDFRNASVMCARHHQYYTAHPIEWDDLLREWWGEKGYAEMRALALNPPPSPDSRPALRALLAELKELEARAA